jgi:hypothetical protein
MVHETEATPDYENELLTIWETETKSLATANPAWAADLAMMFFFVDAPQAALSVIEVAPTGVGPDWLTAELMLKRRQYVDLLEHLHSLEIRYVKDTETAFGVAYLRAQALQALGQSGIAVEILRSIVEVRPDYRSANHLLNEWSVGAAAG